MPLRGKPGFATSEATMHKAEPTSGLDGLLAGLKACKSPEKGLLPQFLLFLASKLAFPPSVTEWLCQATVWLHCTTTWLYQATEWLHHSTAWLHCSTGWLLNLTGQLHKASAWLTKATTWLCETTKRLGNASGWLAGAVNNFRLILMPVGCLVELRPGRTKLQPVVETTSPGAGTPIPSTLE